MGKKDILIQPVPLTELISNKFYNFGSEQTEKVDGIRKLVNMWIKYLLTPIGSNPNNLEEGTLFTALIGSNVPLADARDILASSIEQTNTAIKTMQRGKQLPLDEKFASATITAYIEIPSSPGFSAQILIKSFANNGIEFILPVLEVTQ